MKRLARIGILFALIMSTLDASQIAMAKDSGKNPGEFGSTDPVPTVQLLIPNGGEKFTIGAVTTIKWECIPEALSYSLYLTTDGGKSFLVIAEKLEPKICSHDWNVAAEASRSCMVRLVAELKDESMVQDMSDKPFEIAYDSPGTRMPPRVKTPNGGEVFTIGDAVEVVWECASWAESYRVFCSFDGGKSYRGLGASTHSGCSLSWLTSEPNGKTLASNNCLIKVEARNSSGIVLEDVSNAPFQLKTAKLPTPK